MAHARARRRSTSKKTCVKIQDCGLAVARAAYGRAKGCGEKRAAADVFVRVLGKTFRGRPKTEKVTLLKEANRKIASAERVCGNAAAAQVARDRERLIQTQMDGVRVRSRRRR